MKTAESLGLESWNIFSPAFSFCSCRDKSSKIGRCINFQMCLAHPIFSCALTTNTFRKCSVNLDITLQIFSWIPDK